MFPAKHFYYLSKFIGTEWKHFGTFLGVSKIDLQNIDSSKSISVLEKPFQMLWVWFRKQENGSWELFILQLQKYPKKSWIQKANSITEKLKKIGSSSPVSRNNGAMKDLYLKDFHIFLSELLSKKWYVFGVEMQLDLTDLDVIRDSKKSSTDCSYEMLRLWGDKTHDNSWKECRKQLIYNKEWNSVIRNMDSYIIEGNEKILRNQTLITFYQKFSQHLNEESTILSKYLKIDNAQLDLIDQAFTNGKERAFEILLLWDSQQLSAPKLDDFKDIFKEMGRYDLVIKAEELFEISNNNNEDSMGYIQMYDNSVQDKDSEKPLDQFKLFLSNKLANCWYEVGIALAVNKSKLEDIHATKNKEGDKAYEMLTVFGYQHCSPTWKTVRNVLKKMEYGLIIQETDKYLGGENHAYDKLELKPGVESHQKSKPSISHSIMQSSSSAVSFSNKAKTNSKDSGEKHIYKELEPMSAVQEIDNKRHTGFVNKAFTQDLTHQAESSSADNYYEKPKENVEPVPTAVQEIDNKRHTANSSNFYSMEKKCSGICLIFVTDSDKLNLTNRKDKELLRKTFSYLRFQVIVKSNKNTEEILKIIEKIGFKYKNYDCFVVCVLCRNYESSAESNRSVLQTDSMAAKVTSLSRLQNKPKLFFIQAWETVSNQSNTNQHDINKPYMLKQHVWNDKDIFFSVARGNLLNSKPTEGSWYVKNLCEILMKNATRSSLVGMLSMLGDKFRSDCNSSHVNEISEMTMQLKFKVKKKTALCVLL